MAVMLTCVPMWLGRRLAARAICLSFQIDHRSCTFTISPTTSATGRHLGFERDYYTAFRACYVIRFIIPEMGKNCPKLLFGVIC